MQLITVNYDNFRLLNNMSMQDILFEFNDVIRVYDNSLGTLPGEVNFTRDASVDPKGHFSKTYPRLVERETETEKRMASSKK